MSFVKFDGILKMAILGCILLACCRAIFFFPCVNNIFELIL